MTVFTNSVWFSEYDSATKAYSSLCEIASEACQGWFPAQDKK